MTGSEEQDASPSCPVCGSRGVRIAYGMPGPEMMDAAQEGRIVLGGCVVSGFDPEWACTGPDPHVWRSGEEALARRWSDRVSAP